MKRLLTPLLACLLLGACAATETDVASIPPGTFGPGPDQDNNARIEASRAFDSVAPPAMSTEQSAHAMAAVEYLGGELNTPGRWSYLSGIAQAQMLQAREEVRSHLGVAPGARSQQIVDALLAVSRADNPNTEMAALSSPIFTLGPQATLDRLQHPHLPRTERALGQAGQFEHSRMSSR
jgi:hypothetical protein